MKPHTRSTRRYTEVQAPASPGTAKRLKKIEIESRRVIQRCAFNELMKIHASNEGKSRKGDILSIVQNYSKLENGNVTKGVMNHMILCHKKRRSEQLPNIVVISDNISSLSNISLLSIASCENQIVPKERTDGDDEDVVVVDYYTKSGGGRPKGSTKASMMAKKAALLSAKNEAANLCYLERQKTNNKGSCLIKRRVKLIIEDVESRRNLCRGAIPFETTCSRLKRRYLSGKTWQRASPIETVEPLLVQSCRKLANIGSPLCKDQVISLMESLICNTVHYDSLVEFK
jgi:hypothetical protein